MFKNNNKSNHITEEYCEPEIILSFHTLSQILIIRIHFPTFTVSEKWYSLLVQDYIVSKWLSCTFIAKFIYLEITDLFICTWQNYVWKLYFPVGIFNKNKVFLRKLPYKQKHKRYIVCASWYLTNNSDISKGNLPV